MSRVHPVWQSELSPINLERYDSISNSSFLKASQNVQKTELVEVTYLSSQICAAILLWVKPILLTVSYFYLKIPAPMPINIQNPTIKAKSWHIQSRQSFVWQKKTLLPIYVGLSDLHHCLGINSHKRYNPNKRIDTS